ncbi:E2F/DP family winged-helix DNA-binding domain-containing protein [Perilla frutescens var. hirtella]|nr:E2F/DP family winged-helix DNA-binding domain-containing protein [Perilla frutescens var. hirtella]
MQTLGEFKLPNFFNYPPYFTLQPVKDTREKQIQLWKELILEYCRTHKIFVVGLDEDFPLFSNPVIERSLSHEAREAYLSALVSEGRAEWLDKSHRKCLLLWHRIQDWAELIISFVKDNGLEDSVMTVEEIRSGVESRGTELHGMDRTILMRALKHLEHRGKLAIFKGTSADDEGIKFPSIDCDPKAELPFPDHPMRWDAIVDALNLANYCLAASRHAVPPPQSRVAFLGLHASKKAAFLHSDDEERENRELHYYEITYDEKLMNELPSFCSLKGLPRFHRFTELPEDLQVSIIGRLDGVGFARMRCVSHQFSQI